VSSSSPSETPPTSSPTLLPAAALLPALPPHVPRRRDPAWLRWLLGRVLRRWTWTGGLPDRDRLVAIAWPHTSNLDGVVALSALVVLGLDLRALGKRELFWPPLGWWLRYLGVMPVDRSAPGGMVGRAAAQFADGAPLVLGVAPDGTRRRAHAWRTGWHHIAVAAGVPVAVIALDWGRRQIGFAGTFVPTGDYATDARFAESLLAGVVGRHPDRETPALGGMEESRD
jgi:1-acyl-sn-glycerol-3-phosphate acyltransferase